LIISERLLYPSASPEFHSFSVEFARFASSNPFEFTIVIISCFAAAYYNSQRMVTSNSYSINKFVAFIAHLNRIVEPAGLNISFSFISCLQWQVTCLSFQCSELVALHLMSYHFYFCHPAVFSS
jgi:hypothetical protein